jgi:diacylglycerol kinase family enzyme
MGARVSGADDLAAAVKGPRDLGRDVTAYTGRIEKITTNKVDGTGASAVYVAVGDEHWVVTNLSGGFVAELTAAGAALVGRSARIFMVNGQPEIAYTVN